MDMGSADGSCILQRPHYRGLLRGRGGHMTLEVIGAGVGRTGTYSFKLAL